MIRTSTKYIVIHCAATRATQDVGAREINQWHKARGWSGIGYHFVIRRNGKVEKGRAENQVGSHVAGHNSNSLGVCLVGGLGEGKGWPPQNNFTPAQWTALRALLTELLVRYPGARILGHRDFPNVAKACPSFDARKWATLNGFPAAPALRGKAPLSTAVGLLSGGTSEAVDGAAASLNENSDFLGNALNTGTEKLTEASQYLSWAGYALKVIAFVALAYALYRAGRMAWRWYRGENDFGQGEPENFEDEMPPAPRRRSKAKAKPRAKRAR